MEQEQLRAERDAARLAGVPLGGVGAGCVEYARDGRFRNITINNNRDSASRIAVSEGAFLAVRASDRGRVSARVLQASAGVPFARAGLHAHFTPVEEAAWRGLYPRAEFSLQDAAFPVEVTWGGVCPIIPYDTDASTLPGFFIHITMRNPAQRPLDCAALVNWENLSGCTASDAPEDRGTCHVVTLDEPPAAGEDRPRTVPAGLEFTQASAPAVNAHGSSCLLARRVDGMTFSYMGWDERDPGALRDLWQAFHDTGTLPNTVDQSVSAHSAAVAGAFTLQPGESRRLLAVLTWYRPRFVVAERDQGNGYAAMYANARQAAQRALRYHDYLLRAVDGWQQRFMNSSQPRWLNRMLVNSLHVFSTNTLWTREGWFALFESPAHPRAGMLDLHPYVSLATLLFFPKLEEVAQKGFTVAEPEEAPGLMCRDLGQMCVHAPTQCDDDPPAVLNAAYLVTLYRDYAMTGRRPELEKAYPRARQVLVHGLSKDRDGDGLPDADGLRSAWADGMWLAALRCFAELSRALGKPAEGDWADSLFATARKRFAEVHGQSEGGTLLPDAARDGTAAEAMDDAGALAAQWFCDLLAMGSLFEPEQVGGTLAGLARREEAGRLEWPALEPAHRWAEDLLRGDRTRALAALQRFYENVHVRAGRAFSCVESWRPSASAPGPGRHDRHVSALAVWHVYVALQGVLLHVPRQELWLRVCPEPGAPELHVPVITPGGLGTLRMRASGAGEPYRLDAVVAFDSPTVVRRLMLRIPDWLENARVSADGPEECRIEGCRFGQDGGLSLLEVTFTNPVTIATPLELTVAAREPGQE